MKNLKLDYLQNTVNILLKYNDNAFHFKNSDNNNFINLTIKYEVTDDDKYKCIIEYSRTIIPTTIIEIVESYRLSFIISYLYRKYYISFHDLKIKMCEYFLEVLISNIVIYFEKCGIKVLRYELLKDYKHFNIHTELYGVIKFYIFHKKKCTDSCLTNDYLLLYNVTSKTTFHVRDLCDNDNILNHPLFSQLNIQLQNDKIKCLKVLMLTRELVKEYLCSDLFPSIISLIYKSLFGEECVTGFD